MFSVSVVETDSFLDLPLKSQALYLHLCMRSDDDGFSSPKSVIRSIGCTDKDLKPLIDRNFVIPFKSGVVCITDWHANNTIRKDRRTPTAFQLELSQLKETPTGRYSLVENGNHLTTNCQPDVNQLSTEYSKVKVSVDQYSNAAAAPPAAVAPHKGALGGMTALGSSLDDVRDAETEAARQRFLNSMKRPPWAAADAAPADAEKQEE